MTKSDLWVFGYGSLMWNPGFDHVEARHARLPGLHRAPCIYSWVHRGTKERPGIVLGLAKGGSCRGMAFRVINEKRDVVIDYLRARELVTNVYLERTRPIRLETGEVVPALTYIADTKHEQYAGRLSLEALLTQVRGAVGKSGANEDYIIETTEKMRAMNIHDGLMESIARAL